MFIKTALLYNLRKVRINTEMERLYFEDKHAEKLSVNIKKLEKDIVKLEDKKKKTDKDIVSVSKLQTKQKEIEQVKAQVQEFKLKEEYFTGLSKTIIKNFWK